MHKLFLVASSIAVIASAVPAQAQQQTDRATVLAQVLTPQRVVRLHFTSGRTAAGVVLRVSDSTVSVGACTRCSYRTYQVADVAAVDTMIGHPVHAPRVVSGAFLGGVAAAGTYAMLASASARGCHDGPCGLWVLGVPPTFALGALAGGVIGALHPYVHWDPVALRSDTAAAGSG